MVAKSSKRDFSGPVPKPVLKIDNVSAVKLIKNPEFHNRTKSIDVNYGFVREKLAE